jgi:protein SCO1/2
MILRKPSLILILILVICAPVKAQLLNDPEGWDEETAIGYSQGRIGASPSDYELLRTDGSPVSLSEFRGKPLLVSMIFTACHHVCPTTTRRLESAVQAARDVLGSDSFNVLTIGFDTVNDTPQAMASFARQQGIDQPNWEFLSADFETVDALAAELGFIYYRSPRGFDHITQVSVLDRQGAIYQQVYGVQFELPWLVEPLKDLVYNRHGGAASPLSGLLNRIRLFCTVYDPAKDRYHYDFSIFIQLIIGFAAILSVFIFLVRGLRGPRPG